LKSYTWSFDVVPSCLVASGSSSWFLIPDGNGRWKRTGSSHRCNTDRSGKQEAQRALSPGGSDQNCMVYINTLMLQQILAEPHWRERLTAVDRRALTPLIWGHVNPYGRYVLDMNSRLALSA
jgi:hypothetical protein